jgi:branched-chain amino acid transport system ATP-binding protein
VVLLETQGLSKWFGGLRALTELDVAVEPGEIVGLIGPNGAGKSTALGVISGFHRPTGGRVVLEGRDITSAPPHRRARLGLARMFQQNVLFGTCTVFESVQIGAHLQAVGSGPRAVLRATAGRRRQRGVAAEVGEVLDFVGLSDDAGTVATSLPHGKKRLLGLAITLASRPKVLLLDEPLTGMNAQETQAMLNLITALREQRGMSFVLVEHNMEAVMSLCDRLCVLHFGRRIAYGTPAQVSADPQVIDAYLGVGAESGTGA